MTRGLYETLFAVLEFPDYYNVHVGTALPNLARTAFHETMGFKPIGVYENVLREGFLKAVFPFLLVLLAALHIPPNRQPWHCESNNRMDEIRLPTACPELNPCEGVWDCSKLNDIGVVPQGFEELISRTRSSPTKLQHRDHIHR